MSSSSKAGSARPRPMGSPARSPLRSPSRSPMGSAYYSRLSSPVKRAAAVRSVSAYNSGGAPRVSSGSRSAGGGGGAGRSASRRDGQGRSSVPKVPKFSAEGEPNVYSDRLIPSRADSHLSGARFFERCENEAAASNRRLDRSTSSAVPSSSSSSNSGVPSGASNSSSSVSSSSRLPVARSLPLSGPTSTSSMIVTDSLLMGLSPAAKQGKKAGGHRNGESRSSHSSPNSRESRSHLPLGSNPNPNPYSPRVLRFHSPKKKRARFNPSASSPGGVGVASSPNSSRSRAAARLARSIGDFGAPSSMFASRRNNLLAGSDMDPFALHPVDNPRCREMFSTPRRPHRKIPKNPFKVLDAPALKDDFYLNLIDWSADNVLAVGLKECVYLWSACTSKVTLLFRLEDDDHVTAVAWMEQGPHLAVGTEKGEVQIWDTERKQLVRKLADHQHRVGSLAWNGNSLASGSRDRSIRLRDARDTHHECMVLEGHTQEVCGLKWSHSDNRQLASGGNDNNLLIWCVRKSNQPVLTYTQHQAAVKAIAWSPHQSGLLASGGGTTDRCIRFWNTLSSQTKPINKVDTGSQVCNLGWSKNVDEIISTHGYSLNQIIVWKYSTMEKVVTLTGHTMRVLYLAVSPDGQTVVTGAGDETLRFWSVFPGSKASSSSQSGIRPTFRDIDHIR